MSNVVDERILSMKFDNKQFESGVATSMSTLDKLKQKLNLKGAAEGLQNVSAAVKNINFSGVSSGIKTVQAKFSAMEVVGMTAISRITNSVITLGKRLASAVIINPIKDGFREYETQMNAVQTILANTQQEGTNVKIVNAALDELNHYADKTIYNFTEMTSNIGRFTAAGVKLKDSVSAIKGIANLAAVSGASSQDASRAMYQLSQALASGTVKLMDWNSVVNANMGGKVFQDALIRTSEHLQTGAKAAITANKTFRDSLETGWLTTEVLSQTLDQLSTAADTQEEYEAAIKKFVDQGYSKEEAKQMADLAKTAGDAATKVKTFSQLIDTLKEALGSGWTETWRTIFGDFEEARTLWTSVSKVLNDMITDSSEARNKVLKEWANLGGRTKLIEGFSNIFKGLVSIVTPIKEAFRDIFPPTTAKQLLNLTEGFKSLTEKIKIGDETADKLKRTFKGLFSVVDMVKKAFELVATTIGKVFSSGAFGSVVDIILSITAAIGDMFTSLNEGFNTSGIASSLGKIVSDIAGVLKGAASHISSFGDVLSQVGQGISKVLMGIWDGITKVFGWISDNVSMGDVSAGILGGGIFTVAKKLCGMLDDIKEKFSFIFGGKGGKDAEGIKDKFSNILDSVHDSIQSFTSGIKVASLVGIASAIAILTASLKSLSTLNVQDMAKGLTAMGAMFTMLNLSFKSMVKTLEYFDNKGLIKAGASLILLATAMKILSGAVEKLAKLSFAELVKGLSGVGVGLFALSKGLRAISKIEIKLSTSVAMLALAESCKVLGDALQKFSGLSWDEIARGLTGMGGALAEFVITLKALSKFGGGKSLAGSASLLIAVQSLSKMAEVLSSFAGMSWEEIGRGLAGMGGALAEVSTITGLLGKLTGLKGLLGAGSLVLAVQSLNEIADALASIGALSWDTIKKGLTGMGGALVEIGVVSGALGKLAGLSGLVGAGTIVLAVQSLDEIAQALAGIGSMSWEEIGRGLAGMGGALAELGTASGLTGVLTGFAGLIGAGTITLASQGLGQIADALQQFGSMSWDEIKRGLSAMQDALGEVALGGLMNTLSGFGADAIATVAKPLGDLAESVNKWSSVTVPDNLGSMLTSLADGVLEFTLGGLGAGALATVAKPLGDLAASVQAWSGVSVPENLGTQIGSLASGINKFWASGMGAGAIAEVAAPLGTLAESVKAWSGVTIPDGLATKLQGLANGVMAFSFAFMGGFSIGTITGPLADLATSIQAWSGVSIPDGLGSKLSSLANGVLSFSFAFIGGWSLSAVTGPLGDLAGAVGKWNGINIPENLEGKLTSLANGVKAFSFAFLGGWSLSAITGPLGDLGAAVGKWSGVSIPDDLQNKLTSLANGVKSFAGIGDISSGVDGAEKVASAVKNLSGVDFSSIASGLGNLGKSFSSFASAASSLSGVGNTIVNNLVTPIKNAAKQLSSVGSNIVNSISQGISGASGNLKNAMNGVLSTLTSTAKSKNGEFKSAGAKMSSNLASGIRSGKASVNSAVTSTVSGAASKLRSYYGSFNSAGSYLAQGFASGIRSGSFAASVAARAMANAAKNAAAKALDEHSPSKVGYKIGDFFGVGFTNGIANNFVDSSRAGTKMADNAKEALINAVSKMSNILDSDVDVQPVITPVLDLSNVTSGAASITSLLGGTQSVGVRSNLNAINTAMKLNQNGQNDDIISAIDKLRKDLGNLNSGDTYSINGVYASDDDIVDAIKTIVRAVKVERRV